jgi:hypothetical protein
MPKNKQKLQGEELAWFELAYHLRMPVSELKEKIELSEFRDWMEFLRMERDRNDKLHFYLAQIACEVRRSYIKHPRSLKLQDFLLKFQAPEPEGELSPEHRAFNVAVSKGAWLASLGLQIEGVNKN